MHQKVEANPHEPKSVKHKVIETEFGFKISLFIPENKLDSNHKKIAVIVFPGAGDTAVSSDKMAGSTIENLLKEESRRDINDLENFEVAFAVQMPSIIASEVINDNNHKKELKPTRNKRMENYVNSIIQIFETNPADEIFLVGQSMGGQNLPEIVNLIKTKNPNLNIAGSIFFQSGGLYDQNQSEFLRGLNESNKLEHELSQSFPTKFDIAELEERIREAEAKYQMGLVLKLRSDLKIMIDHHSSNYDSFKKTALEITKDTINENGRLPNSMLSSERIEQIFTRIDDLTSTIDASVTKLQVEKQILKRQKLLMRVINHLFADPNIGKTWTLPVTVESIKEAFFSKNKINKQINPEQTQSFDFPVGVVWAEQDTVFPSKKANVKTGKIRNLFPHAPKIFEGIARNMGHKPHAFNPKEFGKIVSDIIVRMKFEKLDNIDQQLKY